MLDEKIIEEEADAYFLRNKTYMENTECSIGMRIFADFYEEIKEEFQIKKILEVGCSSGYNLIYLNQKFGLECCGIEPSRKAAAYGSHKAEQLGLDKVSLNQGFSHSLPYTDACFDVVYLGFCAYQVDRELLFRTFSETDRVLKRGGFCVITDFDTPSAYLRENVHNDQVFTYKNDCIRYL